MDDGQMDNRKTCLQPPEVGAGIKTQGKTLINFLQPHVDRMYESMVTNARLFFLTEIHKVK